MREENRSTWTKTLRTGARTTAEQQTQSTHGHQRSHEKCGGANYEFDLLVNYPQPVSVMPMKQSHAVHCREFNKGSFKKYISCHLLGEDVAHNSKLNPQGGVSAGGDVRRPSSDQDIFFPGINCRICAPDWFTLNSPTVFISEGEK